MKVGEQRITNATQARQMSMQLSVCVLNKLRVSLNARTLNKLCMLNNWWINPGVKAAMHGRHLYTCELRYMMDNRCMLHEPRMFD